jgi:hypothetical protein
MTIKEVINNPVQIGDFVKVVHGGSKHSQDLIWMVISVNEEYRGRKIINTRLMCGAFIDMNNKRHEVGYERRIDMRRVKKIDVVIMEKPKD